MAALALILIIIQIQFPFRKSGTAVSSRQTTPEE
jgi:hypothetical protein